MDDTEETTVCFKIKLSSQTQSLQLCGMSYQHDEPASTVSMQNVTETFDIFSRKTKSCKMLRILSHDESLDDRLPCMVSVNQKDVDQDNASSISPPKADQKEDIDDESEYEYYEETVYDSDEEQEEPVDDEPEIFADEEIVKTVMDDSTDHVIVLKNQDDDQKSNLDNQKEYVDHEVWQEEHDKQQDLPNPCQTLSQTKTRTENNESTAETCETGSFDDESEIDEEILDEERQEDDLNASQVTQTCDTEGDGDANLGHESEDLVEFFHSKEQEESLVLDRDKLLLDDQQQEDRDSESQEAEDKQLHFVRTGEDESLETFNDEVAQERESFQEESLDDESSDLVKSLRHRKAKLTRQDSITSSTYTDLSDPCCSTSGHFSSDSDTVEFVVRKLKKSVKITEISKSAASSFEEVDSDDESKEPVPVFTFKLRKSRTETAFEELAKYDGEEDDQDSGQEESDLFSESEDDEAASDAKLKKRSRTRRTDSFQGEEKILERVLSLMSFKERTLVESVSKSWQSVCQAINAKTQTSLGFIGVQSRGERLQNFCPLNCHRVQPEDCILITSNFNMISILKKVPNLKSLHIRCDSSGTVFSSTKAINIDENNNDIESEENNISNWSSSGLLGVLCPVLEHVSFVDDVTGCEIYDNVFPIIESCKFLKHLQLRFPCRSSLSSTTRENDIIKRSLIKLKDQMDILSINVPLQKDTCDVIGNFCKLRKLSLHGTTIPIPGLFAMLNEGNVRGKYIKCFSIVIDSREQLKLISNSMVCLASFHCVFSDFLAKNLNPKDVSMIGRLKNLKNLFLSIWTKQLIDEGMIGVALGCSQLNSLTVNAEVSDNSIKYLAFCPLLERLELNTTLASLITDKSISSLSQLKKLRYLTLYYCEISDYGVERLLEHTHELELLSITYSREISLDVIAIVASFASLKPWEKVTLMLPKFLQKSYFAENMDRDDSLPRNLVIGFNS